MIEWGWFVCVCFVHFILPPPKKHPTNTQKKDAILQAMEKEFATHSGIDPTTVHVQLLECRSSNSPSSFATNLARLLRRRRLLASVSTIKDVLFFCVFCVRCRSLSQIFHAAHTHTHTQQNI